MHATPTDIALISRLVSDLCGIVLGENKAYLIEARLSSLVTDLGLGSFGELAAMADADETGHIRNRIIDAITTRETLFFRDGSPFEALEHRVIPDLIDARMTPTPRKRLRFWCAGCASGQEPYSLAILLTELLDDLDEWDIQIHATDISDAALAQASRGCYATHEIRRGLSDRRIERFFYPFEDGYRIRDEIRGMVAFRRVNLLAPLSGMPVFDVILCRNVAIYFGPEDRNRLFLRMIDMLSADGALFVGSSESLANLQPKVVAQHHCRSTYYQRPPAATAGLNRLARPVTEAQGLWQPDRF